MGKCQFSKNCKLYNPNHTTCTKDNGYYYGPGRMGGCGRDFQEKGNKSEYYKKRIEPLTFGEKVMKMFGFRILE